jgi:hypothetical protein
MREYETPLTERLRLSRYRRERYANDPEWRLRQLNRSRIGQGLEPRKSVEEILTPEEVRAVLSDLAKAQKRANGKWAR